MGRAGSNAESGKRKKMGRLVLMLLFLFAVIFLQLSVPSLFTIHLIVLQFISARIVIILHLLSYFNSFMPWFISSTPITLDI